MLLGGVVGVATSTIPVALERLRVEGDLGTPLLCDADRRCGLPRARPPWKYPRKARPGTPTEKA